MNELRLLHGRPNFRKIWRGGKKSFWIKKDNRPLTQFVIASTSGRLHSGFIRLLFLQAHRETDRFFCSFRSSACAIYTWILPLPSRGFFFYALAIFSSIDLVSIFRCSSPPINPVYVRRVNSLALVCSLSSHRQSYIGLIFSSV